MCRKMIALCAVVLLLFACTHPVYAQAFDPNQNGSIAVTLTEPKQKEPIVGAVLSVYCVATASVGSNGEIYYAYTDVFEAFSVDLDDAALVTHLDAFLPREDVPCVTVTTDSAGAAVCDNLKPGLYFVKQTVTVEGFAPCTPFLVTLPAESEDGYEYAVNASPKTEVARLTSVTIRKVWNTDAATEAADRVTVQLLRNGIVIETAVLSEKNDWQVTYTDLPESDAYSVKEVDVPKGFIATYKQNGYVFTVTNTSTLIQTGQLLWPIPVLAGGGVLLIAVGVVLLQKKRKTNA